MDWISRLNRAIAYLEEHLGDPYDPERVASQANMSAFHFQRTFSVVTDLTVVEYLRRRRLTAAAKDLTKGAAILETALAYGYETQASFSRAFRRMHGVTPGQAREPGCVVKAYPPLSFRLSIRGEHSMNYEIRDMGVITIAGDQRSFTSRDGENLREIPKFWEEICGNGRHKAIMEKADPQGVLKGAALGACLDFSESQDDFNYMIGMEPGEKADLGDLIVRDIPAQTWAIFTGRGPMPQAIQQLWSRIFSEWFPATEYSHAVGPELEIYLPGDCQDFQVWIPVTKD